jgi:hypothetical protein
MAERHWGNYNPTDDVLADVANGQDPFGVGGSQYKPGYESLPSQVNINQGAPPTALRIDPKSILRLPKTEAKKGVDQVIKSSFDFMSIPDLTPGELLDASDTEGTLKRTATDGVQSGQTLADTAATTIENLNAMRMAPPTVDPEQTQDAYGMINTPMPTMQDTTIDQWNPAYRNFAIGSAIGNLFSGRGLDGAIQQFGAFADTQQNQAQLAYQKQVAEATQRRQTGLDKLKIIQDIYGTDRQVFNDQSDSIDRQIKIVQDAENRRLDNEAKMDRLMYDSESKIDQITLKGQFDLANRKVTDEGKLRTDLIRVASTGDRSMYPAIAKTLNRMIPGLNLSEGERPYTQRELDYISKIAYRTAITDPTVRNLESGANLKDQQAKQAEARTQYIKEQIRFYPAKMKVDIAKAYAEIENMRTDNTLNQEKFDFQKKNMVTILNQSFTVQRDILAKAEQRTKWLRDQIARVEEEFRGYATLTQEEKDQLRTLKNNLADAIIEQNKETQKYRDMPAQSKAILDDINSVGSDAGLDINASSDELIGTGNARNRP